VREKQVKRENEYPIFVGSVTKSGKMMEKKTNRIIISFYINKLANIRIGIKLAININGIMPFVYIDTLHQKMRGIG
jgi:hypothetical protein